jgi:membrane protein
MATSVERWREEALAEHRPWSLLVELARASKRHRTTGHAAEMAFFAVLTLVPSTIAVGSAFGLSKRVFGSESVARAEEAATSAVHTLMGPQLADNVITPFVHAQLTQPHQDVALGALLVAWWLSSHLFMATGHALDYCYGVHDHRPSLIQRLIALVFALGSVAVVAVTVEMMVSGPLGQLTGDPAKTLGIEGPYSVLWSVVRWPIGLTLVVGFLVCLYRFTANVKQGWRECLPGAVVGACLWIGAAVAFRLTADMRDWSGVASNDPSVTLIGQAVNAVVSTVLWAYLASIAILFGGEVNALLRARRAARAELAGRDHEGVGAGTGGNGDLEPAVGAAGGGRHRPAV